MWWGALAALLVIVGGCEGRGGDTTALGTLERRRIALTAPEAEEIVERPVREGAEVAPGTVVVRLDDRMLAHEVDALTGMRDRARAQLEELERGTRSEQLAQGRAERARTEAAARVAAADAARLRRLAAREIVSLQELERGLGLEDEARAVAALAAARLEELEHGPRPEQIAQARAGLAEVEGRLREAAVRRDRLVLRAPEAATVDELPLEVGERPRPGETVAVLLADGQPYARVFLPAGAAEVRAGSEALVQVVGEPRAYRARVRRVAREAMFTPHFALTERERGRLVYETEVDLVDPEALGLRTGIPVEVRIVADGAR